MMRHMSLLQYLCTAAAAEESWDTQKPLQLAVSWRERVWSYNGVSCSGRSNLHKESREDCNERHECCLQGRTQFLLI
jgi:hypothetical protein